jgi:hypothetical protein
LGKNYYKGEEKKEQYKKERGEEKRECELKGKIITK